MTPADERRLESILRSIDLILEYAAGPDWASDQRTVDAIAKRLEDIGEQAGRLSEEALASLPGVPWRDVIGMRARIVHDYDEFDMVVASRTIGEDLPALRTAIQRHLGRGPG
jgi:uncharacterized protein with HEPN domain